MTAEVTAIGTRCTLCQVQRNAVSGPSPLGRETEPLLGCKRLIAGRERTTKRMASCHARSCLKLPTAQEYRSEPLSVAPSLACAVHFHAGFRRVERATWNMQRRYSHSIVAGGLELTSYTTRFTPRTSLIMRLLIRPNTSAGNANQSAVIPSRLVTARNATT